MSTKICNEESIHDSKIELARSKIADQIVLSDLADLYKVFGDSTRLTILSALCATELRVCDLACLLSVSLSAVSHQLRFLKNSKLIACRKTGKNVYYSLKDDHVRDIINIGIAHIEE